MSRPTARIDRDLAGLKSNRSTRRRVFWSKKELRNLKKLYPTEPTHVLARTFPLHTRGSISAKARELDLRRPSPALLGATLKAEGDIGFCAGMVIADGSILEACISSGARRAKSEGGGNRPRRYYSMPQVKISMEDESLERVAPLWGRKVTFCGTSSTGNKVWSVQVGGKKAKELLVLMMPYLAGPKRKKALYLLEKYGERTCLPVRVRGSFLPFGGMP